MTEPTAPPMDTDRQARYAAAIATADGNDWDNITAQYPDDAAEYRTEAAAVMAVADTEQAELRAEVERLRTDRAAVLREAADYVGNDDTCDCGGCDSCVPNRLAAGLRRLADEAQQPDTIGLCAHCGDPREGHHHGYARTPHFDDEAQQPETEAHRRPGPDDVQVWPLARVLTEVRCGSQDWSWDEEWADLDQRHAASGYLDRLEQAIKTNGITLPVLIGSDGRLWDGHHRLRIAVRLGIGYVPVEVTPREPAPAPAEHVHRLGNPDDDGILDDWDNCRDPECPGPATPAPSEEPTP